MLACMLAAVLPALGAASGGEAVEIRELEWTVRLEEGGLAVVETYQVRNRGPERTLVVKFPRAAAGFDDAFQLKLDHRPLECGPADAGAARKCSFFIDRGQPRRIDVAFRAAPGAPEPAPEAWTEAPARWVRLDAGALAGWREGGAARARVRVEIGERPEHLVFPVPAGAKLDKGAVEWSLSGWAHDLPLGLWFIDAPGPKYEGEAAARWKERKPSALPAPEGDGAMPEWNAPTALLGRFEDASRRADAAVLRGPCGQPHRSAVARARDSAWAQYHAFRTAMMQWRREAARQAAARVEALAAEAERLAGLAETCR